MTGKAARLKELSNLLPHLDGGLRESYTRVNLQARGLNFAIPGINIGRSVEFSNSDARVSASEDLIDLHALENTRAASATVRAQTFTFDSARETVVLAAAGIVTYFVTRPPALVDLTVTGGSAVGAIEGNLMTVGSNQTELVLDFAATTYANETDGAASTFTLQLHTWTLYDTTCGCVVVNVNATVVGAFASDLHPASLQLLANQTGPNGSLQSWADEQYGTNVSFDPGQSIGFYNGSGILSATIVGGAGTTHHFSYAGFFNARGRPWYNRFVGFRATVTGAFTPAVSVGILLKIVNTAGGVWA